MSLSRREQVLGTATVLAILFGFLGMTARTRLDVIRAKADQVASLVRTNDSERVLIELGPQWRARYDQVRDQMPVFEPGRQVDTFWLSRMDALADQFGVRIIRRQVGREELVGDVYEFSIECREWEGTLDAFVHFMHAMQTEGAMLDVRDLLIRPHPSVPGLLRGSFTLFCAYMRGTPVDVAAAPAVPAGIPAAAPPSPSAKEPPAPPSAAQPGSAPAVPAPAPAAAPEPATSGDTP